MILEVAILHIKPEEMSKFEAVFPKAEAIVSSIPGYISNELQRCVEPRRDEPKRWQGASPDPGRGRLGLVRLLADMQLEQEP